MSSLPGRWSYLRPLGAPCRPCHMLHSTQRCMCDGTRVCHPYTALGRHHRVSRVSTLSASQAPLYAGKEACALSPQQLPRLPWRAWLARRCAAAAAPAFPRHPLLGVLGLGSAAATAPGAACAQRARARAALPPLTRPPCAPQTARRPPPTPGASPANKGWKCHIPLTSRRQGQHSSAAPAPAANYSSVSSDTRRFSCPCSGTNSV